MFTFFGLFADPVSDLSLRISQVWPSLHVIRLEEPISAIAVRFGRDHYEPEREDMPMPVVRATERISIDSTFEELAIDSLDATSLLFALEEEFGVSIPDAEARSIRNVRDAVTQVERLLAAKELSQG